MALRTPFKDQRGKRVIGRCFLRACATPALLRTHRIRRRGWEREKGEGKERKFPAQGTRQKSAGRRPRQQRGKSRQSLGS